jgi:hypothetical protein
VISTARLVVHLIRNPPFFKEETIPVQQEEGLGSYLIMTGPHQGIIAQVAADVGRDNLTIDSIARHEVFVLSSRGRLRRRCLVAGLPRHIE